MANCDIYLKPENLQRTGSYKVRGAVNRIARLTPEQRQAGVIASSAGNHAQGVAFAAQRAGVHATIVMPEDAPLTKISHTRAYGAEVVLYGSSYEETQERALALQAERALTFIHPYDDPGVIAGQGTIGLEILEDLPQVDAIVVPVGGGGLIAGVATAVKALKPHVRIIGVQAEGANSCVRSFKEGKIVETAVAHTVADGIKTRHPGLLTFKVIKELVDDVVDVPEASIYRAIVQLLERARLVAEGAGAVSVAAVLDHRIDLPPGSAVVAILSGGNIDVNLLDKVIEYGLTAAGRYLVIRTALPDRPGALVRLLQPLAERRINVMNIVHHRAGSLNPVDLIEVELHLETRDREHAKEIIEEMRSRGYDIRLDDKFAIDQHSGE